MMFHYIFGQDGSRGHFWMQRHSAMMVMMGNTRVFGFPFVQNISSFFLENEDSTCCGTYPKISAYYFQTCQTKHPKHVIHYEQCSMFTRYYMYSDLQAVGLHKYSFFNTTKILPWPADDRSQNNPLFRIINCFDELFGYVEVRLCVCVCVF